MNNHPIVENVPKIGADSIKYGIEGDSMFNQATLMGRITHDLELKTTPSGVNVCSFQIAVDRRYQQKGEERKSDFFTVVAWRQQAEFVHRYFAKGRMIMVVGELQNRTYTSKDGVEVRVTEIIADRVCFTGEKAVSGAAPAADPAAAPSTPPPAPVGPLDPPFPPAGADFDPYPF